MKNVGFWFLGLLVCGYSVVNGQQKDVSLLDLSGINGDPTSGDLFSIEHVLQSGGFSYVKTTSVNEAIQSKVIITASSIETTSFTRAEKDSIIAFLNRGGVAILSDLKDTRLYSVCGIVTSKYATSNAGLNFNTGYDSTIFELFDDPREQSIVLADLSKYTGSFGTRSYTPAPTADVLASFDQGDAAILHQKYGEGHAYVIGLDYKDVILRPQVKKDLGASRGYSNTFEPGQDVFIFMISGILKKHLPLVVNKHTSPYHFKSALVMTHDVDATTSINIFDDYANFEMMNNISATYLVTTHYMHDKIAKDFFDDNLDDLRKIKQDGHDVQSHSVAHVPDFDNEAIIPVGASGNNRSNYQPTYNGTISSNVTVYGEAEVSKQLLEQAISSEVTTFRPGYLAFHNQLINVLEALKYTYSSSHSANDVMTNFPFFSHTDLSMSGKLTNVLEIPNHISDVFMSDPISETNYLDKLETWKTNFTKAYNNNLASVLLIHPNRYFKLYAENLLINFLPQDAVISNLAEYGQFWRDRKALDFTTTFSNGTLTIRLNTAISSLNPRLSLILNGSQPASQTVTSIVVFDANGTIVPFLQTKLKNNDILLHREFQRPSYNNFQLTEKPVNGNIYLYPNPGEKGTGKIHFEIMTETTVSIIVYNSTGLVVNNLFDQADINTGVYDLHLVPANAAPGLYFVKVNIGNTSMILRWAMR